MTNHTHCIISSKENYYLEDIVASFKKFTTAQTKKLLEDDNRKYISRLIKNSYSKKKNNSFQIWQRENYPEIIESEKFFLQKLNYFKLRNVFARSPAHKFMCWATKQSRSYAQRAK